MAYIDEYVNEIRESLRDYKFENQLLEFEGEKTQESTDEQIKFAIKKVYKYAVQAPPKEMPYTLEKMSGYLWFEAGVISKLLKTIALMNIRNTLPVSDGGVQVDENYKAGPYLQLSEKLWEEFKEELKMQKIKYNLESFPAGGTSGTSPYDGFGYMGIY